MAAQLSHVELLHLLFNLTTLWSIGDFEASDGFAAKGGVAYYVQMSTILLLLSGVVSPLSSQENAPYAHRFGRKEAEQQEH